MPKKNSSAKKKRPASIHIGSEKDKSYMIDNLGSLVGAGMDVAEALKTLGQGTSSKRLQKVCAEMIIRIRDEGSLFSAVAAESGVFSGYGLSLIQIGEQSGRLAENMKIVAAQERKERAFKSKLKSAMMYPLFVLSIAFIAGIGIAWFILPRLATVFAQLRLDLPLVTEWLIAFGNFLGEYGVYAVPGIIALFSITIYFIFVFSKTRFIGQWILFHMPGTGQLLREIELARFGYLLGSLLRSGMPITEALNSLSKAATLSFYGKLYGFVGMQVMEGYTIEKSLELYENADKLIPIADQRIISSGEQSGTLAESLLQVGENYEEKVEVTTKNLSTILEPILLVIVWLGVVAVALAVILPIYRLVGGLNTDPNIQSSPPAQEQQEHTENIKTDTASTSPIADTEELLPKLRILSTGIGYLNVRSGPSTKDPIIDEVYPGEEYSYASTIAGWYEIIIEEDIEGRGWISGKYTEIIEIKNATTTQGQ